MRYSLAAGEPLIASAGPDGTFGTADDVILTPSMHRRRLSAAAGCYRVDLGDWEGFVGSELVLDSVPFSAFGAPVLPAVAPYSDPVWAPTYRPHAADSIEIWWQAEHSGVRLALRVLGDSLVGHADGAFREQSVTAHRIPCRHRES